MHVLIWGSGLHRVVHADCERHRHLPQPSAALEPSSHFDRGALPASLTNFGAAKRGSQQVCRSRHSSLQAAQYRMGSAEAPVTRRHPGLTTYVIAGVSGCGKRCGTSLGEGMQKMTTQN